MEITEITRTEMRDIDGSEDTRYTAKRGSETINQKTNGIWANHMTMQEWHTEAVRLFAKHDKDNLDGLHLKSRFEVAFFNNIDGSSLYDEEVCMNGVSAISIRTTKEELIKTLIEFVND